MRLGRGWPLVIAIVVPTFLALTVPLATWPMRRPAIDLAFLCLYSVLALGLAVDLSELTLAFLWRPLKTPMSNLAPERSRTAIVMTICDDWSEEAISHLVPLRLAGYEVFVLDDCQEPIALSGLPAVVVRRGHRQGAKGGNLNHWIALYGSSYDNIVILDADSLMVPSAVDALVSAADHPDNQDVGVFQSKICSWLSPESSLFEHTQSFGARPRTRVFETVHFRLNMLLSSGHNQLVRLRSVRAVGGFEERLTSEDTVLSLDLASIGQRTVLVDVWTAEREPTTVGHYIARTVRWARQTVELFTRNWHGVPLRLKVLLCRHLLSYILPPIGFLLLAVSVWSGPTSITEVLAFLRAALGAAPGYAIYGATLWSLMLIFGTVVVLRGLLARREGVSWRHQLAGVLLGCGPHAALIVPLAAAIASSALGRRVVFHPTNERAKGGKLSPTMIWASALVPVAVILSGVVLHPGAVAVGFNLLWIGFLAASPIGILVLARVRHKGSSFRAAQTTECR